MMPNGYTNAAMTAAGTNNTLGITFTAADKCTFNVGLICDSTMAEGVTTSGPLVSTGGCNYSTYQTSKTNCSIYSLNALWAFMKKYSWLWGTILIIIGLPLCFAGRKLFSVTLFLIGTLLTMTLILLLFYSTFLTDKTEAWIGWVVLISSIILGLAGGFLLFKCQRLGGACIAGWGGFMGGLLLNTTCFSYAQSEALFWIINIACALVAAGLAIVFFFPAIILATSFTGAYFFIRGISLYAGGFPNEFDLIKQLENGSYPHMMWYVYIYFAFIIIFFIGGAVVQFKHLKKDNDENPENVKHPFRDYS
jgi:hypothetical protein